MARNISIQDVKHTIRASLAFKGTDVALTWYKNILGAEENMKFQNQDNKVMKAELCIGNSMIFLDEDMLEYNVRNANSIKRNQVKLHVYVDDVDETIKKALENGATLVTPVTDKFYGDRCGCISDPFGYTWVLATQLKEDKRKVA